jgi:hypothetical protein
MEIDDENKPENDVGCVVTAEALNKSHKVKKKKKKNKKHKHKHKHEKCDTRDTSVDHFRDSQQERDLSLEKFREGHKSSESSTVNSPTVFKDPPSSPEFEVI